ncbi:phospholipid/cholesterol/gamma-HCH transport system substrate-binding protein [Mycobacterium sp. BK086]|uniref:MCE family protein n=1 Tax=Mycobacterium sp. BK086 TaxID=2512165 RepID=UPI00105F6A18|nr:MCE family protein [Mycobacterium sp. BK086]TDO11994.1 phospholipid/cholesterol/gamma-HCH transport system substrate-binding protein [Mycobacterium sp. BK086]
MLKYRGSSLIRAGFIGLALIVLVITIGLQPERLASLATSIRHQALFTEAGGLQPGNDVKVSGVKVGTVSDVSLQHGKALVTFLVKGSVRLGEETSAHIRTGTLLGQRILTLESGGKGTLRAADVIPVTRTGSPYSLTESLSDLAANTADTDTAQINHSLDTLSDTLDRITPQLGPTFDGISKLSRTIAERNDSLSNLLKSAANVTGILSQRSAQVNTLLLNANDLIGVLSQRRYAISNLLASTSALSKQLSGIVADNEKELAPALEKLNGVTEMLEKNNDNITAAMKGLAKFQLTQAEAVNNGFYYNAFVANLSPAQTLQPFFDYALGFRRGTDAGQPADNAGPRAEIPFPYNGIPQPNERWGQP